jgi:hypothetical protein
MKRVLPVVFLPVVLVLVLPVGGIVPSQLQDGGQEGKETGKKQKERDAKKDDKDKKAKRPAAVTIHVKVSGGGSGVAGAAVLVTDEHEYDSTVTTNTDGLATFQRVPCGGHIEIVVTKTGWRNSRNDLERKDFKTGGGEMTIPVNLTKLVGDN